MFETKSASALEVVMVQSADLSAPPVISSALWAVATGALKYLSNFCTRGQQHIRRSILLSSIGIFRLSL